MTLGIEAFQAAATAFGLHLEAPQVSIWKDVDLAILQGTIDGIDVVVQQGYPGVAPRLYFHAALNPPLDLGLSISLPGTYLSLGEPMSEQDVYGTSAFEKGFVMHAIEADRLRSLLTPGLQSALISWHNARRWEFDVKNTFEFWVSDESVILRLDPGYFKWQFSYRVISPEEIMADIRATVGLAQALGVAAQGLLPSVVLAPQVPVWRAFAAAHSLGFSESPLRVFGSFEGVPFSARAVSCSDATYGVEVTTPFAHQLPIYLRLGPSSKWSDFSKRFAVYPDSWTEWAPSQSTGDSEFDKVFRIVSSDPVAQNALLDADIRRALIDLQSRYDHVHLTSTCVSVRTGSMVSPDTFADILKPLAQLEKLIDRAAQRG